MKLQNTMYLKYKQQTMTNLFENASKVTIDGSVYEITPVREVEKGHYYFMHYNDQDYIVEIVLLSDEDDEPVWMVIPKFLYMVTCTKEIYRMRWEYINTGFIELDLANMRLYNCGFLTYDNVLEIGIDLNIFIE